jgi:predicted RNA-binding protein with PIN domain
MNKDYTWSKTPDDSAIHGFLSSNGIVVKRQPDDYFTVYLASEPTPKKDYIRRNITISCLISNCSDWAAKGLTIYALQNWNNFVQDFEKFVNNFGLDDWSVDESALKRFVSKHTADATGKIFVVKIENNNTDETRNELLADLAKYDFSTGSGIKCIIDAGVLTGNDRLAKVRAEADVYLWAGGNKKLLTDDKPLEKNVINTDAAHAIPKQKLPFLKKLFQRETVLQILLIILLAASILCNIYLINIRNSSQKNYEMKIAELKKQVQLCNGSALQWKERAVLLQTNLDLMSEKIDKSFNNSSREVKDLHKNLQNQINSLLVQIQKIHDQVKKLQHESQNDNRFPIKDNE